MKDAFQLFYSLDGTGLVRGTGLTRESLNSLVRWKNCEIMISRDETPKWCWRNQACLSKTVQERSYTGKRLNPKPKRERTQSRGEEKTLPEEKMKTNNSSEP